MKKVVNFFYYTVLFTLLTFCIISCDFPSSKTTGSTTPTVTINGTFAVGNTIIASSNGDFSGDFIWEFSSNPSVVWQMNLYWPGLSGSYNEFYTIQESHRGMYVRVRRWTRMPQTSIYSNVFGPIQ